MLITRPVSLPSAHDTTQFFLLFVRRAGQTPTPWLYKIEQSSVCVSVSRKGLLCIGVHALERGAVVFVVRRHEETVELFLPRRRRAFVGSGDHYLGGPSGDVAHCAGYVVVMKRLVDRRVVRVDLVLAAVHERTVCVARTKVLVLWFQCETLVVTAATLVGIVASSDSPRVDRLGSCCTVCVAPPPAFFCWNLAPSL